MDVDQLVPLRQAAKRTARSDWSIRRLLKQGQLEGVQFGRDWFLTVDGAARLEKGFPLIRYTKSNWL